MDQFTGLGMNVRMRSMMDDRRGCSTTGLDDELDIREFEEGGG
jgi:hypothetical protein